MSRQNCLALTLAGVLSAAPFAYAQAGGEYRADVENGIREYGSGNYQEALASFLRAYQVRPTARVLRGIAKVRFELRQYNACLDAIEAAMLSEDDPLTPEMRAEMGELRGRAQGYVGNLTIRVSPDNATVTLDGQPLPGRMHGVPLRVDIGRHEIEVTANGYNESRRVVIVQAGGDTQLVVVGLTANRTNPLLIGGLVVGIAGVGAAVGSAIWLVNRLDATARCQEAFDRGANCRNADALASERDIALGALIGGSALAIGGAIALGLALRVRGESAPSASVACAPTLGGGACAGVVRW